MKRKEIIKRIILKFKVYRLNAFLHKKYKDYLIFLPPEGLGDFVLACSLMAHVAKKYNKKILMIAYNKATKELSERFSHIDKTYLINSQMFNYLYFNCNVSHIKCGKLFALNIYKLKNQTNMLTALIQYLNLSNQVKPIKPENNENDYLVAKEVYKNLSNGKKIVFLLPFAKSLNYRIISPKFWHKLSNKLISLNYDVVFNSNGHDNEYHVGYKNIFLKIPKTIEFAKMSDYVVSFRSGLSDVLALSLEKPMSVIYLDSKHFESGHIAQISNFLTQQNDKSFAEKYLAAASLNTMFNRNDIHEIIFNMSEDELIEILIAKITNC
jgi:ADP-heptose:LPS heptosyltransferase